METNQEAFAPSTPPSLALDQEAISTLEEIRKWAFFLSIMGFIGVGLILVIGLFLNTILGSFTSQLPVTFPLQFLSVFYLLFALMYFFPVFYLYRFAVQMKIALHQNDHEKLNSSFGNLKSLFRFIGIFTIIILSLYLIVFITAIVVSIIRGF